jgi:adenosylcobinamide-GDP ribazoletransferase
MPKYDNPRNRPSLIDIAVAAALLTRLPLPRLPDRAFARQTRAGWAFALVGAGVGLLAAGAGLAALWAGLPAGAAAGAVLGAQIALTGAMHEDGLADTADGLWGGWTIERRLQIMRDSHIGSYGVLALILSLGLRWVALALLIAAGNGVLIGAVIAAAALSRAVLPGLMTVLPAARVDGLAHGVGTPGWGVSTCALGFGGALAWLGAGAAIVLPALVAFLAVAALAAIARAKIGGHTGDILGAAQQVAEISLLLGLSALAGR